MPMGGGGMVKNCVKFADVISNSIYYSNLCWDEGCGKLNNVRKFSYICTILPKNPNTYTEVYMLCTYSFLEQKELISCWAKNAWVDISFFLGGLKLVRCLKKINMAKINIQHIQRTLNV